MRTGGGDDQRALEGVLEKMLDDYTSLPEAVRERFGKRMAEKESELAILKQQVQDMRVPLVEAKAKMQEREKATKAAIETIGRDVVGRKKTEALTGVIDSITSHFRYTGKKSFLESVDIKASDGSSYSACAPVPG